MSCFSQIIWTHSPDVRTLALNKFRFLVRLSDCSLTHFFTENRLTLDISSSGGAIFLKVSGDIPGMFVQ